MPYRTFSTKVTPQSEPIPGRDMVKNEAGGYAFELDRWSRLDRFLLLGTAAGSYYIDARPLTRENVENVLSCLAEDGTKTTDRIVEISKSGRAPKNEPALFALALASADKQVRQYALRNLPQVARIPTHLFNFLTYVQQFRGWGRALVRATANWYLEKDLDHLAYQAVKYRQRDGWTHRDALRKSHPCTREKSRNALFRWIVSGEVTAGIPDIVAAYEEAKHATPSRTAELIREFNLPRECVNTDHLGEISVWEALLEKMPDVALVRNLGKMTQVGLIAPFSEATKVVVDRLSRLRRVHPWAILNALDAYTNGQGASGLSWEPVSQVSDALDAAFYAAFREVVPTNKRLAICIDVSGSMRHNVISKGVGRGRIIKGMEAARAAAALALITANVESEYMFMGFNTMARSLDISPRMRLDQATQVVKGLIGGGTDYAAPILHAADQRIPVDGFIVLGDMQSWYGSMHSAQAIQMYRRKMGLSTKMAVVSMCANSTSVADPEDAGVINLVGFDTHVPSLAADFIRE